MESIENEKFAGQSFGGGALISDREFRRCTFQNIHFHGSQSPVDQRPTLRNVHFFRCKLDNCRNPSSAVFDNVRVEHLSAKGSLFIYDCTLRHVTFTGRLGSIMIWDDPYFACGATSRDSPERTGAFSEAVQKDYEAIDWAVDISTAEFREMEIRNIPVDLVRRDPETQAIIRAENALSNNWEDVATGIARSIIKGMFRQEKRACLLLAPKRHKKNFAHAMDEIEKLRKAGIADPD